MILQQTGRILLSRSIWFLSHMARPRRSARSLLRKVRRKWYDRILRLQSQNIRRGKRNRCWCGGELLPFEWHPGYGECGECGCYVNRLPPLPSELSRLYGFDRYWHDRMRFKGHPTIERRAATDRADGRVDYWVSLVDKYGPSTGTVIEVGCGHAVLLEALHEKGYRCIGVEPDEETAAWVRQREGLDARAGLFPDMQLPSCDLFLAMDVLEHATDAATFLSAASDLLVPGGIAIIQTPIDRDGSTPPFGEQFEKAFDDVEHLFLFTDHAMQKLAEHSGLEIVHMTERWALHHEICIFRKPH